MRGTIFQKSLHDLHTAWVRSAISDVEALPPNIITDPALAGRLQDIANKYTIEIARLGDPTGGTRRNRDGSTVLDVTIPFTGDHRSFELSPSSSHVLFDECRVDANRVVLTVPDDQNAQGAVDTFVGRANENLDRLREEVARSKPEILEAAKTAADRRTKQIEEERQRDSKLKFPVR